jgi:hypothetical protein
MKDIRESIKDVKGSITVEGAIALPIFLCIIISITFLIKVVYINEEIHYAISSAANEMAYTSYLYHVSGLQEKQESFYETIEEILDSFLVSFLEDSSGDFSETILEELKSFAIKITKGTFDDLKTEICIPMVKLYIKKYLPDMDLDELDFSHSSFFEEDANDIDIIVRYKINVPMPIKVLPELVMTQRAIVNAWMGGDKPENNSGEETDNIWSLNNFQRGKKIRKIFGANLPENFPVLSRYEGDKATIIKSMDTTAQTYQNAEAVINRIDQYIDKLAQYKGQEVPWGSSKIQIKEKDIKSRELIFVIPSNQLLEEVEEAFELCMLKAVNKGVVLRIKRYGYKEIAVS